MTDETAEVSAVALPADAPASFDSPEAAARYFITQKKPTAESADEATADPELSDEDNTAPPEEAHGEDKEADPAATPPIERPKSWTESEDAEWKATPRALQEKIVARELERDNALRRTQNDAAEKLKGLTAKEQAVEQARQLYEAKTKSALEVLEREQLRDFSDIKTMADVAKMAAEDPFRKMQWDVHQQQMQVAAHEAEQATIRANQAKQTERQTRRTAETALLIEKLPEFADKAKLDEAQKAAAQLFRDVGYSDTELTTLADDPLLDDHRIQLIVNDAMKFRALQKAKAAVVAQIVPPVQRPGSARPSGESSSERVQALTQSLNNSGSTEDAVQLLIARRAANQRRAS
jgi:hypothetical protein